MSVEPDHIRVQIAGPYLWATFAIFNGNAFPGSLQDKVSACSTRLALTVIFVNRIPMELTLARKYLVESLRPHKKEMPDVVRKSPQRWIAYADGLGYLASLFSLLHTTKSFLDLYANLLGKLTSETFNLSFKRGRVDNIEIAGGKMINALRNLSPQDFPYAHELAGITQRHSLEWITTLVGYRDKLSHYRDLDGFVHMHVPLRDASPPFKTSEIVDPTMPNGEPLVDYCQGIAANLANFIGESILLVPINREHISVERFSSQLSDVLTMYRSTIPMPVRPRSRSGRRQTPRGRR